MSERIHIITGCRIKPNLFYFLVFLSNLKLKPFPGKKKLFLRQENLHFINFDAIYLLRIIYIACILTKLTITTEKRNIHLQKNSYR